MEALLQEELPEIVSNGAFGKNLKYVSFELNKEHVGEDQYMSTVLFGTVTTSDKSQYQIVIKLKLRNEELRNRLKIDYQFYNEITMYETIIPFLFECHRSLKGIEDWPSLARFFYGRNKCGEFFERDLIVLENVKPLGYQLSEERLFIDYNHLVFALRALAKFHGLSYTAKYKDPHRLQKFVMYLRDTQFDVNGQWILKNNALKKLGKRGVDRLIERSGDLYRDNEHLRRFNELIDDGNNTLRRALHHREPLSVVCHGDFNRNNVLFKYDDSGLPVDVLLFDFGTPRYGSPALDISFFLYMNTTKNMRESHWDDLLNEYCATLAKSVPSVVCVPDRAQLDSEMAACAIFGFAHASFFLPCQIDPSPIDSVSDDEKVIELLLQRGGDKGTDVVADQVQHIVDMGYTNV
uniref:CHK kinase-like domain-containing protein n=1 Tax=Schizaphis graminum TaxID=13262 RepID=A0A2S2NBD3_SCHGA